MHLSQPYTNRTWPCLTFCSIQTPKDKHRELVSDAGMTLLTANQSSPGWVLCKLYRFNSLNARACANRMGTGLRAGYRFK